MVEALSPSAVASLIALRCAHTTPCQGFETALDENALTFTNRLRTLFPGDKDVLIYTRQRLKEIESVDDLCTFFDDLGGVFDDENPQAAITRDSLVGIYIRSKLLKFHSMPFNQLSRLFVKLQAFTQEMCKLPLSASPPTPSSPSTMTVEKPSQRLMELVDAISNTATSDAPSTVQHTINALTSANPALTEVHYASHLNSVNANELTNAVDSLHRFVDFQSAAASKSIDPAAKEPVTSRFPEASLAVAAMHASFGHDESSITALREAVLLSQYSADKNALGRALVELNRLTSIDGRDERLLHMITNDAMPEPVQTSGHLQHAQMLFTQGADPHRVVSSIDTARGMIPTNQWQAINATSSVLMTNVFEAYGHSGLLALYSQLAITQSTQQTATPTTTATTATAAATTTAATITATRPLDEKNIMSRCVLASYYASQNNNHIANALLDDGLAGITPNQTREHALLSLTRARIHHNDAINNKNWIRAEALESDMSCALSVLDESNIDVLFRRSLRLRRQKRYEDTLSLLTHVSEMLNDSNAFPPEQVASVNLKKAHVLLALAETHFDADNTTQALIHGLQCVDVSSKYHATHIHTSALILVAHVQFVHESHEESMHTIHSILPQVFAHGSAHQQADCHYIMGTMNAASGKSTEAISQLEKARSLYHSSNNVDNEKAVLKQLAVLHHKLGDVSSRDRYAKMFRLLDMAE